MKYKLFNFSEFIRESADDSNSELMDLRRLADLGMIDMAELFDRLKGIADRTGVPFTSLIRPEDRYFNITPEEDTEFDSIENVYGWLNGWRGPRGERVIVALGTVGDEDFDLDLTLSSGAKVRICNLGRSGFDMERTYTEVDGIVTHPSEDDLYDAEDRHMDHDDWGRYMQDVLTLTLESSYK